MATAIAQLGLPKDFNLVILAVVLSGPLTFWQSLRVSAARKKAGIKYPNVYATAEEAEKSPAAKVFNCTQRAHGNTLESLPYFIFSALFVGLFHPRAAAALSFIWLVGRVLYTIGYATGTPNKRNTSGGLVHNVGFLGLLGTAVYIAVKNVL